MSALVVTPCTITAARKYCAEHHRHLKKIRGGRFAVSASVEGRRVGIGIVGNGPRVWEGTTKAVIVRVATDGTYNACSIIYGALCRAARALGYTEVWTYTLPEEPGASLKAAGFADLGITDGGEHDRPNQPKRRRKKAERPEPKRRWRRLLTGGAS